MTPEGIARLKADESSLKGGNGFVYDDLSGMTVKSPDGGNLTIGFGHNLSVPMSPALALIILDYDIAQVEAYLVEEYPWYQTNGLMNTVRGDVIAMVEFNTGRIYEFVKMLNAAHDGLWETMALELLDSAAARELPARYARMAAAVRSGSWTPTTTQAVV